MWVQLKSIKRILTNGKLKAHYPGDWVDVGKQAARRWIADGDAWDPNAEEVVLMEGTGILALSDALPVLPSQMTDVAIKRGDTPYMPWERTLLWTPSCPLQTSLLPIGFGFLDVWDVAVPLYDYGVLAKDIGTKADQDKTRRVVRDLRVPVYDTALIFIKRGRATEKLLRTWIAETSEEGDTRLAFLRAFYRVKPLMLPLPMTWSKK